MVPDSQYRGELALMQSSICAYANRRAMPRGWEVTRGFADWLGPYVLATLLGTAVAILQVYRSLPQWFLAIAAIFYAVGVLVIVWPTMRTYVQQLSENRHRKAIADRLFPELRHLAEQFNKYLDPARADNVRARRGC